MGNLWAIPVVLLATAAELRAQEGVRAEMESSLGFVLRISDISGDVDTGLDVDYGDLWDTGFGFSIESNLMFPLKKNWSIGPYLSGGFDLFQGGEEITDPVGDSLEADDLFMSTFLVGFKAMLAPPRGFFFDGRFGLGPAFWSAVDGDITISGTTFGVTVFDSSVTFAVEFGARVGYSLPKVFFGAGFSVRSLGKPDEADLDFEGTSSAAAVSFELEIGLRY